MGAKLSIGAISDTHGYYDPRVDALFAGAVHIVHAGDVGGLAVLERLRRLAPLTAVAGNTDVSDETLDLPMEAEVGIAGLRVFVCHIGERLAGRRDQAAEGPDLIVNGHSHAAAVDWRQETLFLNPGSAGRSRFGRPRTVALVDVEGGKPSARIIALE
jgi:uncharacterized protein